MTITQTQSVVLRTLAAAGDTAVSGEQLSGSLGLSRAAVSKAVHRLRDEGYVIQSSTRRGHRLVSRPDKLTALEVEDGLETVQLGHTVYHFDTVDSTQRVARELAEQGCDHGAVVVAEQQTRGRGRLGRDYCCPRGGIWCTAVLRGPLRASQAPIVGLAAGVAAATAIRDEVGLNVRLKWPNDVLINGRKVCGILTELVAEEHAVHYLLVGVGINANVRRSDLPSELEGIATSLGEETGTPISRRRLLQGFFLHFEQLFGAIRAGASRDVIQAWRTFPNMLGQQIRVRLWDEVVDGTALDIDEDGALLIRTVGGEERRLMAGDVLGPPDLEASL